MRLAVGSLVAALAVGGLRPGMDYAKPSCRAPGPPSPAVRSYAGLGARDGHGLAATVRPLRRPVVVRGGFVAAWVGASSGDAWVQAGFASLDTGTTGVYYEYREGAERICFAWLELDPAEPHRFAVLEMAGRRDRWRVWVDGAARSEPIRLKAAADLLLAATVESKVEPGSRANRYAYRFLALRRTAAPGGLWQPVRDAERLGDVRLRSRTPTAFTAVAP